MLSQQMLNVVVKGEKAMKKLVVGMLIALAIAPVATAFAELQYPPDVKPGTGTDAVGADLTYINFYLLAPTVSNQTLNLTFILAVNNILNSNQNITIETRTLAGSVFTRTDPYGPRVTRFFSPTDVQCPVNNVCQLTLAAIEPPGNICFIIFDSLLIIFDNTSGDIVSMLQTLVPQCVQ
jgi:hypothetical protein